jgi:hypothetical protein
MSHETVGISYNVMLFIRHPLYVIYFQIQNRGSEAAIGFFSPGILGQGSSCYFLHPLINTFIVRR